MIFEYKICRTIIGKRPFIINGSHMQIKVHNYQTTIRLFLLYFGSSYTARIEYIEC